MQIILIRHLETHYNKAGLLQGQMDIPILDPEQSVILQIDRNKHQLNQMPPFDAVFVSELQRTLMTAEHYGYSSQDVIIEPLLNEFNFGEFEGKNKADLIQYHGELWYQEPEKLILGEPLKDVQIRIEKFLKKYQQFNSLLLFSHGSWSRALCSLNEHGDINQMNQMHIPNNELIKLDITKFQVPQ